MSHQPKLLRRYLAAAAGAVMAIGLAGCGSGQDSASNAGNDTLRVVVQAQPSTLDPIVGARGVNQYVWGTVLEPLVGTGEDLEPTKDSIITDWERTDDTTWTLTVREGLEFSNGEPADAAAVANTLTIVRDSENSILKSYWANAKDISAPDPTTVVIKTSAPQYDIPDLMGTVYLVPPKYYKEQGTEGFSAAPIGTGPYLFDGQNAGRDMTVVRNPDYWGDAAEMERIVFSWSAEPAQRLALLRSDAADVAFDLPATQAEEADQAGLDVTLTDTAVKMIGFLHTDRGPFNDPDVAKAAALAVNRDEIVEGIFGDRAIADGGLLNVKPGTEPAEQVEADPEEARELMQGKTVPITLTYPAGQYSNIEEVAQAMGSMLEDVGFKVTFNALDYGTLVTQVGAKELDGITVFAGVPNVAVPDFFASGFMKSASITANCQDPKIDEMIADALAQPDEAAANEIYDELNTLGVVSKNCYIPMYRQVSAYATADGVSGVHYDALNAVDLTQVAID